VAILHKGSLSKGFRAIWFASKITKKEKTFKEEKEKYIKTFNEAMLVKDQEITQYSKRVDELGNLVMAAKSKENDLLTKVKQKDKQIATLEFERNDPGKTKKSPAGDRTAHSIRALEERVGIFSLYYLIKCFY
jgi:23S rRNA pseudoU1915 N3-methylase RlmH